MEADVNKLAHVLTVAHTHSANQRRQALLVKNITHHSVSLALVEFSPMTTGDDAASILTSMLQ